MRFYTTKTQGGHQAPENIAIAVDIFPMLSLDGYAAAELILLGAM